MDIREVKIDVKFLLTIGTIIVTMAGFYYTTTYRLDALEEKVKQLESNNEAIIRLEERLKNVQNKTQQILEVLNTPLKHANNNDKMPFTEESKRISYRYQWLFRQYKTDHYNGDAFR